MTYREFGKGDMFYHVLPIILTLCTKWAYMNHCLYMSIYIHHILFYQMMMCKEVLTSRLLVFAVVFVATASTDFIHALSQTIRPLPSMHVSPYRQLCDFICSFVRLPCHDAMIGSSYTVWSVFLCSNNTENILKLGGGFPFLFHLHLGKIPILTNTFQMGWFNHQPEKSWIVQSVNFLGTPQKSTLLDFCILSLGPRT